MQGAAILITSGIATARTVVYLADTVTHIPKQISDVGAGMRRALLQVAAGCAGARGGRRREKMLKAYPLSSSFSGVGPIDCPCADEGDG